jgi:hypothetical protein
MLYDELLLMMMVVVPVVLLVDNVDVYEDDQQDYVVLELYH